MERTIVVNSVIVMQGARTYQVNSYNRLPLQFAGFQGFEMMKICSTRLSLTYFTLR